MIPTWLTEPLKLDGLADLLRVLAANRLQKAPKTGPRDAAMYNGLADALEGMTPADRAEFLTLSGRVQQALADLYVWCEPRINATLAEALDALADGRP